MQSSSTFLVCDLHQMNTHTMDLLHIVFIPQIYIPSFPSSGVLPGGPV